MLGARLGLAEPPLAPRARGPGGFAPGSGRPRGRSPPGQAARAPRPGFLGAARAQSVPQAARCSRAPPSPPGPCQTPCAPPSPAHTHPATGAPAAAASAPGAPCSPGGSDSPPPPPSPPPLLLLLLQLRLLQSRRSSAWAARLLRSPREPINPSAGAYVRPWLRSLPPASFPPSSSRPGPGAGPGDPSVQPRPLPESRREEPQRPPAPPIRRFASNKHKLSQAPPHSR
ncbi:vegetative cell wall protein gp1-like [Trachypithecus francoisi]|uniref:vegetative cell wall protein gp1-like n=1 Tax=Trachypithecus francoisi TaxID=54180 RepID=UPI00141BD302|nr:vegetative cell wall protein gp1-like [Trachypithecus francoisi]